MLRTTSSPDVTFTTRLMRTEPPYFSRSPGRSLTMLTADHTEGLKNNIGVGGSDGSVAPRVHQQLGQQADHCGTMHAIKFGR